MFKPNRNKQNRRRKRYNKYKERGDEELRVFLEAYNFDKKGLCSGDERGSESESNTYTNVTPPKEYQLSEKILKMYEDKGAFSCNTQFVSHFPKMARFAPMGARLHVPLGRGEVTYGIPVDTLSPGEAFYRALFVPERFHRENSKARVGEAPHPRMEVGGPSRDDPKKRFTTGEPYAPWVVEVNPLLEILWYFFNRDRLMEDRSRINAYNPHIYLEGNGPVLRQSDLEDKEFARRHRTFFEDNKTITFELEEMDQDRIHKAFVKSIDFVFILEKGVTHNVLPVAEGFENMKFRFTLDFKPVIFTNVYTYSRDPLVTGAFMALLSLDTEGVSHLKKKTKPVDKYLEDLREKVQEY